MDATLRPWAFTISELSQRTGWSPYRIHKFMTDNGVHIHKSPGGKRVVLTASLMKSFPEFADSVLLYMGDDE